MGLRQSDSGRHHRAGANDSKRIDTQSMDGRIFTGTVENDVRDTQGRLAIPRRRRRSSSCAVMQDNDLVLDLDSVTVNGAYGVDATRNR